jgi:hypothetical protein
LYSLLYSVLPLRTSTLKLLFISWSSLGNRSPNWLMQLTRMKRRVQLLWWLYWEPDHFLLRMYCMPVLLQCSYTLQSSLAQPDS